MNNDACIKVTVKWPDYDVEFWRDWLLEYAGEQHVHWDWGMSRIGDPDLMDVLFLDREVAMLFILRWGTI